MSFFDKYKDISEFLQPLMSWLILCSVVTFILSLLCIPWIVGRLSPECFLKLAEKNTVKKQFSVKELFFLMLGNFIGLILLLAGIVMLFLPGQGLLTMLLGILLLSFPGKRKLTLNLVRRPRVQQSLDWIRLKQGKPSFVWPDIPKTSRNNSTSARTN